MIRPAIAASMLILLFAPALRAAPTTMPATTRAAGDAEIVMAKLDRTPTLVTGKVKDQSASELFFRLAAQAGGGIAPQDPSFWDDATLAASSYSAEWDKQPFWDALAESCDTTSLRVTVDPNRETSGQLRLELGQSRSPTSADGIALVRAQNLVRDASISFADNTRTHDRVQLTLQMLLEPKLRGMAWVEPPVIEKADDEAGHSLLLKAEKPGEGAGGIYGSSLGVALAYPQNAGDRIALVGGSMRAHVATEIASVRLPQPFGAGKPVKLDVGPNKLVIQNVTPNADGSWSVFLTLDRDKNDALSHWKVTSRRFCTYGVSLSMLGGKGPFRATGGSAGWGDEHAEVRQSFAPSVQGDLATEFRVEIPLKFEPLDVKFEFKDLPLP